VERRLESCDEFWQEVPDIGPEGQSLAIRYGIAANQPLEAWLTQDDSQRVRSTAQANGVSEETLTPLRPWLAAQVLRMAADARLGLKPEFAADSVLAARARGFGLKMHSECPTAEAVFQMFAGLSREAEAQYLRFTLYEIDAGLARVEQHAAALERGDFGPIERETAMMQREWPALYEQLVLRRNEAWLPRIERMMAAGTRAFITVGTAHLVGPDGLLETLPRAGYRVQRAAG
jgi:uncharacterized protein YbaP (TraB family)